MGILDQIATALNRRDEIPNQELAKKIAVKNDSKAVKELVENLHNKSKDIQHDCIKVLYEIGEQKPKLIVVYLEDFVGLLTSRNNRMQWGAMAAIDSITTEDPKAVYSMLSNIIAAADNGSVITRDRAVSVLIKLCLVKQYAANAFSLLTEQLLSSPTNQLAMYAERALPVINEKNKKKFKQVLSSRLADIERDTLRQRVEKVIRKIA
jgi:hypothetical protein